MRELSLFTGAGGGLLGSLILGWRTVAAVEIDPYCQRVLCARGGYVADAEHVRCDGCGVSAEQDGGTAGATPPIREGFPVYPDVRTFHPVPGSCDIVTGGFPCQPFSQAGKRLGEDDPRNMWPHAVRVLRESGAPLGFFENVPGLLSSGYFGTVLGDLAEAGFDAEWCVLGADDVGAPHRRKRLWILAYRGSSDAGSGAGQLQGEESHDGQPSLVLSDAGGRSGSPEAGMYHEPSGELADAEREQLEGIGNAAGLEGRHDGSGSSPWWCDPADVGDTAGEQDDAKRDGPGRPCEQQGRAAGSGAEAARPQDREASNDCACGPDDDPWLAEPYVGRVATGVASRVDRLRALGNGQVPQTMAAAFTYLARDAGLPGWDDVTASVPTAARHDESDQGGGP